MKRNSDAHTSLVTGKTRVAPVKAVTLPRLKLLAAMTASSLAASLRRQLTLPLARIVMWSDSTVVLGWIRSDPNRWRHFVRNRCLKIRDNTEPTVTSLLRKGQPGGPSQ